MRKVLVLLASLLSALPLFADVPTLVNFQGKFSSSGTITVDFYITDSSPSSSSLWSETAVSFTTTNGVVSYLLGNTTPIPSSVFTGSSTERYLKVVPSGGSAQYSRLVSVPFAYRAAYADSLAGGATVQGSINIAGTESAQDILPLTNSAYSLGASSAHWANVYADTEIVSNLTGGATVQGSLNIAGFLGTHDIYPASGSTYSLGRLGSGSWGKVFVDTLTLSGSMNSALSMDGNKITMDADRNSYILSDSDNQISFFLNGTRKGYFDATRFILDGTKLALDSDGDADSYLQSDSANQISTFINGTRKCFIDTNAFYPTSHKGFNMGSASVAWNQIYANGFNTIADVPFPSRFRSSEGAIASVDPIASLRQIKPLPNVFNESGLPIWDDSTIPKWMALKQPDGTPMHDPDGKSFVSLTTLISTCMTAIVKLDDENAALKAQLAQLKDEYDRLAAGH